MSWTGVEKGRARATLAQADRLLSPLGRPVRRRLGRKARALEALPVVLAVRRVAIVQRRQALGDRQRRRERESRQALLLGRVGGAELGVARGQAGATIASGLLMHLSASSASP